MDEATLAEGDNTDEIIGAIRRGLCRLMKKY